MFLTLRLGGGRGLGRISANAPTGIDTGENW